MVDGLLDTSIIVDVLRKHPPAVIWLQAQQNPGVTSVVWMEIIEGARDRLAQVEAIRLLNGFELIAITQQDHDWAVIQMLQYQLSHQIGMADAMIAAVGYRHNLPLYTMNLKHFTPMIPTLVKQPY